MKFLPHPGGTAYVVTPKGQIRGVVFSSTVHSALLDVDYERDESDRPCAVRRVRISRDAEEAGYKLLKDLYEAEGIEGGFETYLSYEKQGRRLGIHELDDAYLPDEVIRRRNVAAKPSLALPPPVKGSATAEQPKASAKPSRKDATL